MCLALLGPGDTALVPAPSFPIHVHAVALASANVIALDVREPECLPRQHRAGLREPVSQAQDPDPQLPAQPVGRRRREAVLRGNRAAGEEVPLLRDPRLRLRRRVLRRLADSPASCRFPARRMSAASSRRCPRATTWPAGASASRRATAQMLNALKAIKGYYDYGIFQAVQIAAIVALRHGEPGRLAQVAEYQNRRDVLVESLNRARLGRWRRPRAACSSGRRSPSPGGRGWGRSTSP